MKRSLIAATAALAVLVPMAASADDDGPGCDAPMTEWQPRENLKLKLKNEGWDVRRIKTEDGCYEVYAIDNNGRRVEAYFNPKTLIMLRSKKDD